MTSDAKVGLLLGLVFIVIIAFLINGLPHMVRSAAEDETINTNIANIPNDLDISERADEAVRSLNAGTPQPPKRKIPMPPLEYEEIRFTIDIPEAESPRRQQPERTQPQPTARRTENRIREHVVRKDETLASIASKIYGEEAGNTLSVIDRIFQANRDQLSSPHDIRVGQKLVIPPLYDGAENVSQDPPHLAQGIIDNIRELASNNIDTLRSAAGLKKHETYTVKPNENLWEIAAKHLGSGIRYKEIVKLNEDVIDDENRVAAGTKLKLPER